MVFLGCLVGPVLLCSVGSFFAYRYVSGGADRLPGELAKLKALGVPTEPQDLQPKPPVSDAENAALYYGSIGLQLEALKPDEELVKLLDGFCSPAAKDSDLGAVLQAIQKHQGLFADFDKAAARPYVDFKRDYREGFTMLLPEYGHMKRMARWQCSRARAEWKTGNRTAALETLRKALVIGDHARQESHLIGQLVAIAVQAIVHRVLEEFMVQGRNDLELLNLMQAMVSTVDGKADMRKAFGGELVSGRQTIQGLGGKYKLSELGIAAGVPNLEKRDWLDSALSNPGLRKMFEARFCEAWRKTFEAIPSDKNDWTGFSGAVAKRSSEIDSDKSLGNIVNRVFVPVLYQAVDASAKQLAERRLELLSLRLLQIRSKGLPSDLSRFGDLGIDPFTGKSMGYKRDGRAFKVWSVGHDRVDHGGAIKRPKTTGTKGFDIVMGFDIPIPQVPASE